MTDAQKEKILRYLLGEIDVLLENVSALKKRILSLENADNSNDPFLGDEHVRIKNNR